MKEKKSLGIMTYIDSSKKMLEDFSWLYKSWIYSGCWRTSDLIVVHHPEITEKLPKEAGVVLIPCLPTSHTDPLFKDYHFINSIGCLTGDEVSKVARHYDYLLRTDADVFLTKNLASFKPNFPVHGRGNYYFSDDFKKNMLLFCEKHRVKHHHRFGCGHSIMASSELVIDFLQRQLHWSRVLMQEFGTDPANWGEWPHWCRGVTTMYAAEITANERWGDFLQNGRERILDIESNNEQDIDILTLHIHGVHTTDYFSKFDYRDGKYDYISPDILDKNKINQYCHWICMSSIEDIKAEAGYLPN